jgi:CubicO group peptidase (beta-lactamase class C family)
LSICPGKFKPGGPWQRRRFRRTSLRLDAELAHQRYGWGGIYGTQFRVDPTNRVVGLVMTQTAIIGSGAISNPVREAFYTVD